MSADLHHIPAAALQQAIDMPEHHKGVNRPAGARTDQPSETTRRRWARMAEKETAAREAAHADGVREGYRQGWRWGLCCGLIAAALLGGLCWGGWLVVNVPDAVASVSARAL